jgi:hypothetical protein
LNEPAFRLLWPNQSNEVNSQQEETEDKADSVETEIVNARRIFHEFGKLFISSRFRTRKSEEGVAGVQEFN